MGQIDVNQIGEKETQIGDAGQAEALEIGPQIRPVVLVTEYITEALEGVAILLRQACPGFCQAIYAGALHGRNNSKKRV